MMIFNVLRYVSVGYLAMHAALAVAGNQSVVTNNMKEAVRVYWTAAGCAKVVDGKTFVCESRLIAPGQASTYEFKALTSVNKVVVSGPEACDGLKAVEALGDLTVNSDCSLGSEASQFSNNRKETIKLYWVAIGCVRVEDGVPMVCRSVRLAPNEKDSYAFPKYATTRGVNWTSATCPTSPKQRFFVSSYTGFQMVISDDTACGSVPRLLTN
jgi:hypothetical protein